MDLDIAMSIYEARYKEQLSFDKFLQHLENGIALLKRDALAISKAPIELSEMQLALEYNLECLTSVHTS